MEKNLSEPSFLHKDLRTAINLVYSKCKFNLSDFKNSLESSEYGACSFSMNGKIILHRNSKITPTKTGQFVTIWKRNKEGITQPFDFTDNFDFVIITTRCAENLGQFIFPKSVLANKGIITRNGKEGKRGIRVYAPWDKAASSQALKTQNWQTKYFLTMSEENLVDLEFAKQLLSDSF